MIIMGRILTRPEEVQKNEQVFYAGNHYLSIPVIKVNKGTVQNLNIVSLSSKSLVELAGKDYLFCPFFYKAGKRLEILKIEATRKGHYLPELIFDLENNIKITLRIYTDLREKGLIWDFSSTEKVKIRLSFDLSFVNLLRFNRHRVGFEKKIKKDRWLNNPVLDIVAPDVMLSLAFGAEDNMTFQEGEADLNLEITCNERNCIYIAINSDPDGASTTLIHLKRKGYRKIYDEFISWLKYKTVSLPGDPLLEKKLNENLFFNYFFAIGKNLKSDRYVALTSRSPRYYVSGAFWERDSFLWSLPAIKIIDRELFVELAEELILTHSKNAGDHAHYLDGTVLYPGFELDQAASYFILIDELEDDFFSGEILRKLYKVFKRIEREYDQNTGLYKTFLLPSDDPARYPLVTIDNVILWKGLKNFTRVLRAKNEDKMVELVEKRIEGIRRGIYRYLVAEVKGRKMFLWSTDGKGNFSLYNDPPGNLGTLSFYGFVNEDDPIFKNTIDFYYSSEYEYYFENASIRELACDHHPRTPSGLGLCGSLLNPLKRKEALEWLRKADMDYGLLAESFDRNSGEARTGVGFATGAGYLAYALYKIKEAGLL